MMKGHQILVLALLVTACGGDGEVEGTIADETVATTTTTSVAAATTQAPIGVPFTGEEVLEVPGISDVVGSGTIVFTIEDGSMRTEFQSVSVPAVDGKMVCPDCAGSIVMGADVVLSSEMFLDPDYDGEPWYIVAGPGGATLDKVGAGFRLVEGEAFLVDDLSLISTDSDAAAESATSTEPTTEPEPTLPIHFEDQFDGALSDGWNWVLEDADMWSLTAAPGWLQITAADRMQNVLVRDTPGGAYEVTTALRFRPTSNFQFAGLIVAPKSQQETFLQLGRAYCGPAIDFCIGDGVYLDNVENGEMVGSSVAESATDTDVMYLRLVADGDLYAGYLSEDGETWTLVGEHTRSFGDAEVGLIAHQAFEQPALAQFDYVTVTPVTTTRESATTTTSTTIAQLPSYEDVVATYPEGVILCTAEAELNGQSPDGSLEVTIMAGALVIDDELQFPCWGMRFKVLEEATLDNTQYPAGSVLVVGPDADPSDLSTAVPAGGIKTMLAQPTTGTWAYTGGMDWVRIDE